MTDCRIEKDSLGSVQIPSLTYYGAQTQRAVNIFSILVSALPAALIRAMGLVKFVYPVAKRDLGKLTASGNNPMNDFQVDVLLADCREVHEGKHFNQFPGDVFPTGFGTSSNRNVDAVTINHAIELLDKDRFTENKSIHPNNHVNRGQIIRELRNQKGVLPRLQLDDTLDHYRMTEPLA